MRKLSIAILAMGIGLGFGVPLAAQAAGESTASREWIEFKSLMSSCEGLLGTERSQCMENARNVYRSSRFDCNTMLGADRAQCLMLSDRWGDNRSAELEEAVETDKAPTPPIDPSDPTDELRNRDSRKQQDQPAQQLPEPRN
jgi:hypothetical protein